MRDPPRSATVAIKLPEAMPVRTIVVTVREGADPHARWEGEQGGIGTAADNDLVLTDDTVSRYHVRLTALKNGVQVHDFGSTNGTLANGVRIERAIVPGGTTLTLGHTKLLVETGLPSTVELHDEDRLGDLRGQTANMRRLMKDLRRVAMSPVPVLLIGESGTGKELFAIAIRDASARAKKPFVTVDCGSLTPSLIASELFGHEQGAFTGAVRRRNGAFEHADGGTLFLDEIGELPPDLQSSLLGALERKRFCRVGGDSEVEVDVRVVAATNRDLRAEVNAGSFRLDLYYRLAVVTLEVPPLRERVADIPLLIEHFVRSEGVATPVEELFSKETLAQLSRHRWPGNVRELRNYVQATLAMGEPVDLRRDAAGSVETSLGGAFAHLGALAYGEARRIVLGAFEERYFKDLLDRCDGNVAKAAREADMARSHLNELLRRHNLRGVA